MAQPGLTYRQQEIEVVKRYFTGSNTLVAGQPLCYQESPATASVTEGVGIDVEIPVAANEGFFAGIVADTSVGFTGPGYIDMYVPKPGDVLNVLVGSTADVTVGDILSLNWDLPTTAGGELGAFDPLVLITATGSVAGTDLDPLIVTGLVGPLCKNLVSVASSSVADRVLVSCMFV